MKYVLVFFLRAVFLHNLQRDFQQADTGIRAGLLPFNLNPQAAVRCLYDMLVGQPGKVGVTQSCECRKNKHITGKA